jgi:hypothetical protein
MPRPVWHVSRSKPLAIDRAWVDVPQLAPLSRGNGGKVHNHMWAIQEGESPIPPRLQPFPPEVAGEELGTLIHHPTLSALLNQDVAPIGRTLLP